MLIGWPGRGGGGGGGRIAVWRLFDKSPSQPATDVSGGLGYNDIAGDSGTVVWGLIPGGAGSIVVFY